MTQQALSVVKAFPYIAEQARIIEIIAALHGEPSISVLTQARGDDDFEHHVNWQQVVAYLGTIGVDNIHLHVALNG